MEIGKNTTDKKCLNQCPNCGASDDDLHIKWGLMEIDSPPYQKAECKECGCEFHEVYTYSVTVFNLGDVDRVSCEYPMNYFYSFMDEVPEGTRVSTSEDCEKCEEKDCDVKYCLFRNGIGEIKTYKDNRNRR